MSSHAGHPEASASLAPGTDDAVEAFGTVLAMTLLWLVPALAFVVALLML